MCDPFCENPAFLARAILTLVVTLGETLTEFVGAKAQLHIYDSVPITDS